MKDKTPREIFLDIEEGIDANPYAQIQDAQGFFSSDQSVYGFHLTGFISPETAARMVRSYNGAPDLVAALRGIASTSKDERSRKAARRAIKRFEELQPVRHAQAEQEDDLLPF